MPEWRWNILKLQEQEWSLALRKISTNRDLFLSITKLKRWRWTPGLGDQEHLQKKIKKKLSRDARILQCLDNGWRSKTEKRPCHTSRQLSYGYTVPNARSHGQRKRPSVYAFETVPSPEICSFPRIGCTTYRVWGWTLPRASRRALGLGLTVGVLSLDTFQFSPRIFGPFLSLHFFFFFFF